MKSTQRASQALDTTASDRFGARPRRVGSVYLESLRDRNPTDFPVAEDAHGASGSGMDQRPALGDELAGMGERQDKRVFGKALAMGATANRSTTTVLSLTAVENLPPQP